MSSPTAEKMCDGGLETTGAGNAPSPPSKAVRIIGRIILAVLPFVFLILLEGLLRVAGLGFNPSFFVAAPTSPEGLRMTNPDFGRRFFPRHMVRAPVSRGIVAPKPEGTFRAFVLGGSAAMGDPDASYSLSKMLQCELAAQFPDRRVEIVNAAMTAINSHVVLPIARDCLRMEPDVLIVYMGNNEVVGPFGLSPASGQGDGFSFLKKIGLGVRRYRIGQVIADMTGRTAGKNGSIKDMSWQGMEHFLDVQVSRNDPRLSDVYASFRHNLREILETSTDAGVPVLLCTVPVNVLTCPPFSGRPVTKNSSWDAAMIRGFSHEKAGLMTEATRAFQEAATIDGDAADGWFCLGKTLLKQGKTRAAREALDRARDTDRLRFRADSRIEEIIREAATDDAITGTLIEAAQIVAESDGEAEPVFVDHVHLSFVGTKMLSDALFHPLAALLAGKNSASVRRPMNLDAMRDALAYTLWDELRIEYGMFNRRTRPPFVYQINWQDPSAEMTTLARKRTDPDLLANAKEIYLHAFEQHSEDPVLARNGARLLMASGDVGGAMVQWRRAAELQPFLPEPLINLGNICVDQGNLREAERLYRAALELYSDCAEAYSGLGRIALQNGVLDAAETLLEVATKKNPGMPEPHNNLAGVYIRTDRPQEAIKEWRIALALRPTYAGARLNLARALWGQGHTEKALAEAEKVLQYDPDSATAAKLADDIRKALPSPIRQ